MGEGIGTLTEGEIHWDVADLFPVLKELKSRVYVFGVSHRCGPSEWGEMFPTIKSIRPDTDRSVEGVSIDLNEAVEELLNRSGSSANPILIRTDVEELWSLDDTYLGVFEHIRKGLDEKVLPWTEIRIEYDDELTGSLGEGVAKISRLLQLRSLSSDVVEAESLCKVSHLITLSVIENVDLYVRMDYEDHVIDVIPCILNDRNILPTDGEKDVDRGILRAGKPLRDEKSVSAEVKIPPKNSDRDREHEVKDRNEEDEGYGEDFRKVIDEESISDEEDES